LPSDYRPASPCKLTQDVVGIDLQGLTDVQQVYGVDPPIATLVFGDEALGLSQASCDLDLSEPRTLAGFQQQAAKCSVS